jgi:EGF domain
MILHQGDFYKEHAVDVVDENAEEYFRSLRITYSEPLPPGCLVKMGRFHVNYTIATPWTSYQFVRVTRNVIVNDIDECSLDVKKYSDTCPQLIPQCHESATCINTIGSYTCQCPKFTSGDGFKKITSGVLPDGYQGGTGCVDTSKPVITLKGPNPKIIKVCKCGVMGGRATNGEEALCTQQRNNFGRNLKVCEFIS